MPIQPRPSKLHLRPSRRLRKSTPQTILKLFEFYLSSMITRRPSRPRQGARTRFRGHGPTASGWSFDGHDLDGLAVRGLRRRLAGDGHGSAVGLLAGLVPLVRGRDRGPMAHDVVDQAANGIGLLDV